MVSLMSQAAEEEVLEKHRPLANSSLNFFKQASTNSCIALKYALKKSYSGIAT